MIHCQISANKNYRILTLAIILTVPVIESCKKFIEVGPPKTELVTATVYDNNSTATAALTAIYAKMIENIVPYDLPYQTGLYGDELKNYSTSMFIIPYYTNSLNGSSYTPAYWSLAYNYIYHANAVLEGCNQSSSLNPKVKKQLMAEAKFIRSFWYFYLVNLYGDVPLITTTDYSKNSRLGRTSKEEVYTHIINDLLEAKSELNMDYVDNTDTAVTVERVRPNKAAAAALLARVYLYTEQYKFAEDQASFIINNINTYDTVPLKDVFLKNSKEAIWQIPPSSSSTTFNTQEGKNFILIARPDNCSISEQLIGAFEPGDRRIEEWIDSIVVDTEVFHFPFKYKVKESSVVTEYSMALRLSEQYLIRAEARAYQGNISGAQNDLNIIRHRAGLSNTTATTKEDLMTAILHERRVELFTEWGHRWLDLKRTNNVNEIMTNISPLKGGTWQPYKALWPIPQIDINNNPNLTQTPNYN